MQEFMIATDMTSCGSTDEKLRWAFKMYDEDGSGNEKKCPIICIDGITFV